MGKYQYSAGPARASFHALSLMMEASDPSIGEGMRVRIRSGPLQGLEGWVERRYGITTVLLRLDFINRAAAVKIDADQLTPT